MKVRIKKTGQILNVEYDDDDLYKGWDGGAVWFYANEFDIIDEEEPNTKPLFTLTAEEVTIVEHFLTCDKMTLETYESSQENDIMIADLTYILNKIKDYQNGH